MGGEQAALFVGFRHPDPENTANRVSADPANTYVEEYVSDLRWGICSMRTMYPIPLAIMFSKFQVAIMTCSVVRLTRRVQNRKETTKYDHIFCFIILN